MFRPTFKLFKNGQQIGEIVGAKQEELRRLIELNAGTPEESGLMVVKGHVRRSLCIYAYLILRKFIALNVNKLIDQFCLLVGHK